MGYEEFGAGLDVFWWQDDEMESDKEATDPSPAAQPVDFSNSALSDLNESEGLHPDQELIKNCALFTESSNRPLSKVGSRSTDSLTTINLPRFFEDEFPDLMREVNENVQRSRNARKTPPEPVHPDLLPFDLITDPERLSWLANGLVLNPLTNRPIDWSDFEEQIDIAVDELAITSFFRGAHSKSDILEFREHFKRYEGLSIPMVAKMLDRVAGAAELPKFKPSRKERVDHDYFARIIKDLKTFNRYFEELFRETFAPLIDEHGEARFEQGHRFRWWPAGEEFSDGEYSYPLCESPENMPEPFRSVLEEEIAKEREKLLGIESSQRTLQDAQDEGEIEMPPGDQDLLCGEEMDALWSAEDEKREREEEARPAAADQLKRRVELLSTSWPSCSTSCSTSEDPEFNELSAGWWRNEMVGKPNMQFRKGQPVWGIGCVAVSS